MHVSASWPARREHESESLRRTTPTGPRNIESETDRLSAIESDGRSGWTVGFEPSSRDTDKLVTRSDPPNVDGVQAGCPSCGGSPERSETVVSNSDDALVVRNTRRQRFVASVGIVGLVVGFAFALGRLLEKGPLGIVLGALYAAIAVGGCLFVYRKAVAPEIRLGTDFAGIHVCYPVEFGLLPWNIVDEIGARRRHGMKMLFIRVCDDVAPKSRSIWTRAQWWIWTEETGEGIPGRTFYVPESILPLPAEDFAAALEAHRQRGPATTRE